MSTVSAVTSNRRGWWTAFVAGMASYLDGAAMMSVGSVLVLFQNDFGLSAGQIGQLSALLTLFFAFGALIGGRLGDRFGRKHVFTMTIVGIVLAAGLLAISSDVWMLYLAISALGFFAGADLPVSLAMIAEAAPEGRVGRMITVSHYLWMVGMLVTVGIGVFAGGLGALGGRIYCIHVVVVGIVALLLRLTLRESAEWREKTESLRVVDPSKLGFRGLLRSEFVRPLIATGLFYGIVMIATNSNNAFAAYIWVNAAGSDIQTQSMWGLVTFAVVFIGTTALMRIVDSKHRMTAFAIAAVVAVIAFLVPAVFGFSVATLVVSGVLFALGGAIAGEPMYKVWSQELFPTEFRASAQGATMAFARGLAALIAVFVPTIVDHGPELLYYFLAAATAIACLIGIFWVGRIPRVDAPEPTVERSSVSS